MFEAGMYARIGESLNMNGSFPLFLNYADYSTEQN
jgi:hypothetical protein